MRPNVFTYPLTGDRPYRTLLVGALSSALGLLVLPAVFVAGYYGRVLRATALGSDEAPGFGDWRELATTGLGTWAVVVLYYALSGLLFTAFSIVWIVVVLAVPELGDAATTAYTVAATVLLAAVLWTPIWFFVPVALTNFAVEGRFGAAFDIGRIVRLSRDPVYLLCWAQGLAVVVIGSLAYASLVDLGWIGGSIGAIALDAMVPTIGADFGGGGHLLGVTINFYCQVVAARLFGRGYAAARERIDAVPAATTDESVDGAAAEW